MNALILCGGQSSRMNSSKSLKMINGKPAYLHWINIFKKIGIEPYISCRQSQKSDYQFTNFILDNSQDKGPMNGIHAAIQKHHDVAWFIFSVDLFCAEISDFRLLINSFIGTEDAICYCNKDRIIYPLFSIISPKIYEVINNEISGLLLDTTLSDTVLNFDFSVFSNKLENASAVLVDETKSSELIFSELEELVLFLIVIGKVDKEISEILQLVGVFLSRAGISKFITRKLFPKVDADSRNKLISQVFYLGLINRVPKLILNNQQLFKVTFN